MHVSLNDSKHLQRQECAWLGAPVPFAWLRKVLPHHNNWMREKEKYIAHIAITLPSRRLLRQERQFITGAYLSYWCASVISNHFQRVSLVGQMVKKLPEIQETRLWSLIWENSHMSEAIKPLPHNFWACALEPGSCTYWNLHTLGAHALPQEKPLQWEGCSLQLEKSLHSHKDPAQPKINTFLS